MVAMTELTEKEAAAELLLNAKGFENVVVNLTGETADVVVPDIDLEDAKRAQIEDIVKRKTGVAAENIIITPLSESSDEAQTEETADETTSEDVQTEDASVSYEDTSIPEDSETSAGTYDGYEIDTEGIYD